MELTSTTSHRFLGHAFDRLLSVADRMPESLLNTRPFGRSTNSVASLLVHCCGVVEYWLGHIALDEPTSRDREREFEATATNAELHGIVAATLDRARRLLDRLDADDGIDRSARPPLYGGDTSDAAIVLHVLEECFQHLGHAEVTADALLSEDGET